MGKPIIKGSDVTREQSVTDIIESTAQEQAALSHILNAEAEKIQAFTAMPGMTQELLADMNKSVRTMVDTVTKLETHLHTKLNLFGDALQPISFSFYKRDSETGTGVGGAVFELSRDGTIVCSATSSKGGRVKFTCLETGAYTLTEVITPPGYQPDGETHTVEVVDRNNITIDGEAAADFVALNVPYLNLTVLKIEDFDVPQANATFQLAGPNGTFRCTTGTDGLAVFERVDPGTYSLTEVAWPAGFLPDLDPREVIVAPDGTMTIDGTVTNTTTFQNFATTELNIAFSFVDSWDQYGMRPATFMLNIYQNGTLFSSEPTMTGPSGFINITNLRKYDDNDEEYIYSFDGDPIAHYNESVVGNRIYYVIQTFDLAGTVVWVDSDETSRPTEVTIHLMQDETEIDDVTVTSGDSWQFTFTDLPVGHTYTLEEDPVPNYEISYTGFNVVNTIIT